MKRNKASGGDPKYMNKILESLMASHKAPIWIYVLLLVLYLGASAIILGTAGVKQPLNIMGFEMPVYAFAGVFSALSNICIIFMVVYYGKLGFFSSLVILLMQFPILLTAIFKRHNISGLPGTFTNALTIVAIIVIHYNNMRIEKYQERLREQAVTDRLTSLPNRFACSEMLNDLIKRKEKFALVSIDLNGFKSINDTMGFKTGNDVLCQIADRWRVIADVETKGTVDFVARVNGDEFMLIIRGYRNDDELKKAVAKYESVLSEKLTVDGCDFYLTASFGYAEFPKDAKTSDAMFMCADAAMYEVKRINSSNHILRFTPELIKTERTLDIERMIRNALENDTIFFNLQPQFDLSHKLRGFEALARLKDENGNNISPGEFIPVAEKVGLIDRVDAAVFRKSSEFFGDLLKKSGAKISLSVNTSVRHLMKNDFLDELNTIIKSSGVPAGQLEIEITESVMIDSPEKALQCINSIKEMGIKIAIDDFGTGYSSLSYLYRFPADLLKVDKSFIDKINSSTSSKEYVASIISIGHIMGYQVISEGVEEDDQLETLRSIGCDLIQGYVWGRPLMPEAAEELVMQSAAE